MIIYKNYQNKEWLKRCHSQEEFKEMRLNGIWTLDGILVKKEKSTKQKKAMNIDFHLNLI